MHADALVLDIAVYSVVCGLLSPLALGNEVREGEGIIVAPAGQLYILTE